MFENPAIGYIGARAGFHPILLHLGTNRIITRKTQSLYLIKITHILVDICGIKSVGCSKIILLDIWGLREVFTTHFRHTDKITDIYGKSQP